MRLIGEGGAYPLSNCNFVRFKKLILQFAMFKCMRAETQKNVCGYTQLHVEC